jgi:hypothetical protein
LWFVSVIGLIRVLYPAVAVGYQKLPFVLPLKHERLLLAATGISLLLVFIAFLLKPGNYGIAEVKIGWDYGAFIALIAAITAAVPLARPAAAGRNAVRTA